MRLARCGKREEILRAVSGWSECWNQICEVNNKFSSGKCSFEVWNEQKICKFLKCAPWSGGNLQTRARNCLKRNILAEKKLPDWLNTYLCWKISRSVTTGRSGPTPSESHKSFIECSLIIPNNNAANICRMDWRLRHCLSTDGCQGIHQSQRP